ncbi:MAG: Glucoamylase [Pseudonocardiales bacterium]|nr:Glucoamylase [Pseudonocardiales bacterium]
MSVPELDRPTSASLTDPAGRVDGYVDLDSYAAIGDTRTIALVALDGGIDWWPIPDLDSWPPFAAIVDARNGGRLELHPVAPFESTRRYLPGTNVLETTHTTADGVVRVTDSLNIGLAGPLPWAELARRIDGIEGHVAMKWTVAPGTCLNAVSPWAHDTAHGIVLRVDDLTLGVRVLGPTVRDTTDQAIRGSLMTSPGSRHLIGVAASYGEPLHLSEAADIDSGIDRTIANWQRWSDQFTYDGEWGDAVRRSVLILKLLTHSPSGAIAAAATTSLPETMAGGKNWDYRFAWIRDTAYILKALFRFGLREETQAAVSWLLHTICRHGPEMHVFYKLDGELPGEPAMLEAPGWRDVGPVVSGNRAADQLQLSVFGDLFDTVRLYVDNGHVLDTGTGRMLANIADQACDAWRRRDAGLWELERKEHYTSSKLSCWQALRCAVHLAKLGEIPGDSSRWEAEAARIRDWVDTHCWSVERQSYVWFPGSEELDTSILLHAGSGFNTGERMSSTIDALRKELGDGALMHRYSGAQKEEGAFVAASFWVVSALHWVGRTREARELMTELVRRPNDVGVLPEMIAANGDFLGNLPQGLSHLALVGAALDLDIPS